MKMSVNEVVESVLSGNELEIRRNEAHLLLAGGGSEDTIPVSLDVAREAAKSEKLERMYGSPTRAIYRAKRS